MQRLFIMPFEIQNAKLNHILASIPVFKNLKSVTLLAGGLTNTNYRVDTTEESFVLRISDNRSSALCINRDNERINTAKAFKAGVGPELVYTLPTENALVIRWIEATTLHAEDIQAQPGLLERMADSLRQLHGGSAFSGSFDFTDIRKKYLDTVLSNHYFLPIDYLQFDPLIMDLEAELISNPELLVPCNNDLLAENFLDDSKKIWIIDYEYSGQNEASFEIGNLASETGLDDEQLSSLCDAYWQEHLPGKVARAMAWSIIARYGWTLWASIQEAISPIDFDFHSWGMKKWNSVLPELQGERYKIVLENLKKYNT